MGWKDVNWIHLAHGRVHIGSCERRNESSGFPKGEIFLEYLSDCLPLKKKSASRNQLVSSLSTSV
jgi:hypothetical protein